MPPVPGAPSWSMTSAWLNTIGGFMFVAGPSGVGGRWSWVTAGVSRYPIPAAMLTNKRSGHIRVHVRLAAACWAVSPDENWLFQALLNPKPRTWVFPSEVISTRTLLGYSR